ncbi:MAG: hypothetical protein PHU85_19185 [Phycisphaerae bacterium]|nr:hypothetical protein [Phycisphaerae bacterium]
MASVISFIALMGSAVRAGDVKLQVKEGESVDRKPAMITTGVPFAKGRVPGIHNDLLSYTVRITTYAGAKFLRVQVWLEDGAVGYYYQDKPNPAVPEWFAFKGMCVNLGLGLGDNATVIASLSALHRLTGDQELLAKAVENFADGFPESKCPPVFMRGNSTWTRMAAMTLRTGHLFQYALWKMNPPGQMTGLGGRSGKESICRGTSDWRWDWP